MELQSPRWASSLSNLYWFLRAKRRFSAPRRRWYRLIAEEKKRLLEAGVDGEELRLYCRVLANPANMHASRRWEAHVRRGMLARDLRRGCGSLGLQDGNF